ncbi:S-layer homology domain-containing protein [Sporosarcina sp. CAU 1771]
MQKSFSKVVILLLVFTLILPSSTFLAAGDTTPPELHSLQISPEDLNVGDTVVFTADITDDLSGVSYVSIVFSNEEDINGSNNTVFLSYDKERQLFIGQYTIQENDTPGMWTIYSYHLRDNAGNSSFYNKEDILDSEKYFYLITNENEVDKTPPTLEHIEISPKVVEVGEEVEVKIKAFDLSGVERVNASFESESGKLSRHLTFSYNEEMDYWIAKYKINTEDVSGIWNLRHISLTDINNNRVFIQSNELDNPEDYTIEVINEIEVDSLPPEIEWLKIEPREVNTNDTFKVSAKVTDNISGVSHVSITLKSVTNLSTRSINLTDQDEDGVWEGNYTVSKFDESGKWIIDTILANDHARNSVRLSTDDFPNNDELNVTITHPPIDGAIPSAPIVHEVTTDSQFVTGTVGGSEIVTVRNGEEVIGTATARTDGQFSVSIPKQKAGTTLEVVAENTEGNVSEAVQVNVSVGKMEIIAPEGYTVKKVQQAYVTRVHGGGNYIGSDLSFKYMTLIDSDKYTFEASFTLADSENNSAYLMYKKTFTGAELKLLQSINLGEYERKINISMPGEKNTIIANNKKISIEIKDENLLGNSSLFFPGDEVITLSYSGIIDGKSYLLASKLPSTETTLNFESEMQSAIKLTIGSMNEDEIDFQGGLSLLYSEPLSRSLSGTFSRETFVSPGTARISINNENNSGNEPISFSADNVNITEDKVVALGRSFEYNLGRVEQSKRSNGEVILQINQSILAGDFNLNYFWFNYNNRPEIKIMNSSDEEIHSQFVDSLFNMNFNLTEMLQGGKYTLNYTYKHPLTREDESVSTSFEIDPVLEIPIEIKEGYTLENGSVQLLKNNYSLHSQNVNSHNNNIWLPVIDKLDEEFTISSQLTLKNGEGKLINYIASQSFTGEQLNALTQLNWNDLVELYTPNMEDFKEDPRKSLLANYTNHLGYKVISYMSGDINGLYIDPERLLSFEFKGLTNNDDYYWLIKSFSEDETKQNFKFDMSNLSELEFDIPNLEAVAISNHSGEALSVSAYDGFTNKVFLESGTYNQIRVTDSNGSWIASDVDIEGKKLLTLEGEITKELEVRYDQFSNGKYLNVFLNYQKGMFRRVGFRNSTIKVFDEKLNALKEEELNNIHIYFMDLNLKSGTYIVEATVEDEIISASFVVEQQLEMPIELKDGYTFETGVVRFTKNQNELAHLYLSDNNIELPVVASNKDEYVISVQLTLKNPKGELINYIDTQSFTGEQLNELTILKWNEFVEVYTPNMEDFKYDYQSNLLARYTNDLGYIESHHLSPDVIGLLIQPEKLVSFEFKGLGKNDLYYWTEKKFEKDESTINFEFDTSNLSELEFDIPNIESVQISNSNGQSLYLSAYNGFTNKVYLKSGTYNHIRVTEQDSGWIAYGVNVQGKKVLSLEGEATTNLEVDYYQSINSGNLSIHVNYQKGDFRKETFKNNKITVFDEQRNIIEEKIIDENHFNFRDINLGAGKYTVEVTIEGEKFSREFVVKEEVFVEAPDGYTISQMQSGWITSKEGNSKHLYGVVSTEQTNEFELVDSEEYLLEAAFELEGQDESNSYAIYSKSFTGAELKSLKSISLNEIVREVLITMPGENNRVEAKYGKSEVIFHAAKEGDIKLFLPGVERLLMDFSGVVDGRSYLLVKEVLGNTNKVNFKDEIESSKKVTIHGIKEETNKRYFYAHYINGNNDIHGVYLSETYVSPGTASFILQLYEDNYLYHENWSLDTIHIDSDINLTIGNELEYSLKSVDWQMFEDGRTYYFIDHSIKFGDFNLKNIYYKGQSEIPFVIKDNHGKEVVSETSTNFSGHYFEFSIKLPPGKYTLEFSFTNPQTGKTEHIKEGFELIEEEDDLPTPNPNPGQGGGGSAPPVIEIPETDEEIATADEEEILAQLKDNQKKEVLVELQSSNNKDFSMMFSSKLINQVINSKKPLYVRTKGASFTLPTKVLEAIASKTTDGLRFSIQAVDRNKQTLPIISGNQNFVSSLYEFNVFRISNEVEELVTEFVEPVKVTLELAGVNDIRKVAAYYLNSKKGKWEFNSGSVDANQLTFEVSHFSQYAAIENDITFKDIQSPSMEWAKDYIEVLASKTIIQGKSADQFAPNEAITRAQFALLLARALNLPKQSYSGTFSDVPEKMDWAVSEIEAAARTGIVKGSNGKFNPYEQITRQQMAAMIMRAIEFKDARIIKGVEAADVFSDADKIHDYAQEYVGLAATLGIISGSEKDGKRVFKPTDSATRAHAAKMLYQMLDLF